MASRPTVEVDSWEVALALLRYVRPDAEVTVSKVAEPLLPPELALRRSDVPWSVHKGARHVYREDRAGTHVQIREYPDRWTLQVDSWNPHYRPARHVARDTPAYVRSAARHPLQTAVGALLYGPARYLQLLAGLAGAGAATVGRPRTAGLSVRSPPTATGTDPRPPPTDHKNSHR